MLFFSMHEKEKNMLCVYRRKCSTATGNRNVFVVCDSKEKKKKKNESKQETFFLFSSLIL